MRKIWKYGAFAAAFLFIFALFFSFASVSLLAVGQVFSATIATSYPAEDPDITAADLYFSQLEAALQDEIDNIQETYPDYAAYVYELDGISHDPFQLMAYLSAMYEDFSFEEIKPELDALFAEAYSLTLETDGSTLYVKLEKRDFEEIFGPKLAEKGTSGMYDGYIDSRGNHQRFGTPFNFPWYDKISCLYGERDNPTGANTGYNLENGKEFHTGLDIAVPVGTPVYSVMEGTVTYAGWDNLYGWYVDVTDKDGNKSRYTHNSAILVNSGDKVLRGQAISESGRTGNVTGPHLHIEIFLDGERVNPIFLLEYQP
jgi:murein DD-endopeptidase MepM/ murein hydrolase activator NlpD